jgi:hypothetical protein
MLCLSVSFRGPCNSLILAQGCHITRIAHELYTHARTRTYSHAGGLHKVSANVGSGSGSKATALAVAGLADIVSITLSDAAHASTLAATAGREAAVLEPMVRK